MESTIKIIRTYLLSIFFSTIMFGCWTFENDITETKSLTDPFKIIREKNNPEAEFELSLKKRDGLYEIIETRCKTLYYDSTRIFVIYTWSSVDTTLRYDRITILEKQSPLYKKQELTKEQFYASVKKCKNCLRSDF